MVFELFRGGGGSQIELIEGELQEMLAICGETFEMAMDAVLGRVAAGDVGERLRKGDRKVNRTERSIRRQLLVHAGVRGAAADIPVLLVSMSISKDIERVGDYAKNIWDLAAAGVRMDGFPEGGEIRRHAERTRGLIDRAARLLQERDTEGARQLLPEVDEWLDEHDAIVAEQLVSDRPSREGVPVALFYRYLKRIDAHLMNVLTSLVMPLDRLDFWDEDKADRE